MYNYIEYLYICMKKHAYLSLRAMTSAMPLLVSEDFQASISSTGCRAANDLTSQTSGETTARNKHRHGCVSKPIIINVSGVNTHCYFDVHQGYKVLTHSHMGMRQCNSQRVFYFVELLRFTQIPLKSFNIVSRK